MSIFVGLIALCAAIAVSFSDKIIEHFSPNGGLASFERETDDVLLHIEEENEFHRA